MIYAINEICNICTSPNYVKTRKMILFVIFERYHLCSNHCKLTSEGRLHLAIPPVPSSAY